jgi:hypothetical protein
MNTGSLKKWKLFLVVTAYLMFCVKDISAQSRKKAEKLSGSGKDQTSVLTNFDKSGNQITRFDALGNAIDAHDGEIAYFGGTYYLYGTSYDCGFAWQNKKAPFCGFKTYSSKDLVNWTDRGFLFDAQTPVWQTRCNGNTYGCFRPHVVFNQKTNLYVLWINVYDNRVGFRVFTSKTPVGPFTEVAEPTLAVNSDSPVAGLNNGDHDTFVDDDGTAYIAYTDWRTKGIIVIEKLNADYLSGTGEHVKTVTAGKTEAPGLFKRNGIYYVTYSDPNCGYCSGTGTSYKTAHSLLGPWSEGIKISDKSCGGQPSFVSTIKLNADTIFLYGSDLWNNAARNEALANYYWAPLAFNEDGSIKPMICKDTVLVTLYNGGKERKAAEAKDLDNSAGVNGFITKCDIAKNMQRSQSFIPKRSGDLSKVTFTTFKNGNTDDGLQIEIYQADQSLKPVGKALHSTRFIADSIGWAPKNLVVLPNIKVEAGKQYAIIVKSGTTTGCYGLQYNDVATFKGGSAAFSVDNGAAFTVERERTLKFETFIKKN